MECIALGHLARRPRPPDHQHAHGLPHIPPRPPASGRSASPHQQVSPPTVSNHHGNVLPNHQYHHNSAIRQPPPTTPSAKQPINTGCHHHHHRKLHIHQPTNNLQCDQHTPSHAIDQLANHLHRSPSRQPEQPTINYAHEPTVQTNTPPETTDQHHALYPPTPYRYTHTRTSQPDNNHK